jgi:uncharacterized delta-60 repeat protein
MMRKSGFIVALLPLLFAAPTAFYSSAFAGAGSLDPSFGQGGKVLTRLSNCGLSVCNANPADAVLQPDGKIVVAESFQTSFGAMRYLPDGSLDTSFGNGGMAQTGLSTSLTFADAIALQSDGKIVVAGQFQNPNHNGFVVARYNADGSSDTSFGTAGHVTTDFGHLPSVGEAVLIQPDGKILLGGGIFQGKRQPNDTVLIRYNPDGSLDQAFGNGGEVAVVAVQGVSALGLDSNEDVFVLDHSAIAEFTPGGKLDSEVTPANIEESSPGGVFLFNGEYIDAQTVAVARHTFDAQVVEFNAAGTVDSAFNNPPFVYVPGGTNSAGPTAFQADGKIVAGGGHCAPAFNPCTFGLARLSSSGSLDSTFGKAGVLTTQFSGEDTVSAAVLIQPDGRILAVGSSIDHATGQANTAIARYLPE